MTDIFIYHWRNIAGYEQRNNNRNIKRLELLKRDQETGIIRDSYLNKLDRLAKTDQIVAITGVKATENPP